jgi:tetratricopeptide (TPR) repeat protein
MKKKFILILFVFMLCLPAFTRAEQMEMPADPKARAHFLNGLDLFLSGLYDEAIAEYREVIKIVPNDAYAHNFLAHALMGQGLIDEAIAEYRKAIEINPRYAYAHNNLGEALYKKGLREEAKEEWEKALKIDRRHTLANRNLRNAKKDEKELKLKQEIK